MFDQIGCPIDDRYMPKSLIRSLRFSTHIQDCLRRRKLVRVKDRNRFDTSPVAHTRVKDSFLHRVRPKKIKKIVHYRFAGADAIHDPSKSVVDDLVTINGKVTYRLRRVHSQRFAELSHEESIVLILVQNTQTSESPLHAIQSV